MRDCVSVRVRAPGCAACFCRWAPGSGSVGVFLWRRVHPESGRPRIGLCLAVHLCGYSGEGACVCVCELHRGFWERRV